MAFSDYLDLRAAVVKQVGRADIAEDLDVFTGLAEARINRDLRSTRQVATVTLTLTDGTADLPADLQSVIGLFDSNGFEYTQQGVHFASVSGAYSVQGDKIVSRDLRGECVLKYRQRVPTLTTGMSASNWVLATYPSVYLYAVACEAAKAQRDPEAAQAYRAMYDEAINEANTDDLVRASARMSYRSGEAVA